MHDEPGDEPGAVSAAPPVALPGPEPATRTVARSSPEPRARRPRPWRAALLPVMLVAAFAVALPFALLGREVSAPSWLRERVEAAASAALDGGTLSVGRATLRVPPDLHPEARLLDVSLRDRDGRLVARVPELRATLSPRGLLFERAVLVQEIALVGPELTLTRGTDGRLSVAMGAGGGATLRGLAELPGAFDRLFDRPALAALRRVGIEGLVVNYDDARAGRAWTVDGGTLSLEVSGAATRLVGDLAVLSGRSYATRARLDYQGTRGSRAARLGLALTDVAAADVASQAPALAWLGVVDAPISASLRAETDAAGALGPVSLALKIAGGSLRPVPGAAPIPFDLARAYGGYEPATGALRFDRVEVRSAWGGMVADGRAWLREAADGLPRVVLGQMTVEEATLAPPGVAEPIRLGGGQATLRLRLRPFGLDVAEAAVALPGGGWLSASGTVGASPEGWSVSADARLPSMGRDAALALWPAGLRPGLRAWVEANVTGGEVSDLAGALRVEPGAAPAFAVSGRFDGLAVRALPTHPPIEGAAGRIAWDGAGASFALEAGTVRAPEGGAVDLAGTALTIPADGGPRAPATLAVAGSGTITAALSLLDMAPLRVMAASGLPPSFAAGTAEARGTVGLFLTPMTGDELSYDLSATLRDVATDALVPGRRVEADALALTATPEAVEVAGRATVGGTAAEGTWRLDPRAGSSALTARVPLTPAVLADWGVALPPGSVAGEGAGTLDIRWERGAAPAFALGSDLRGLALSVPALGWSKGRGGAGTLSVAGTLAPLRVPSLSIDAAGLSAAGSLALTDAGGFEALALDRLEVGNWLDVAATVAARRGSDAPAVEVASGTLDLSRMPAGGSGGEGGPVSVRLDRLTVADGLALAPFAGDFDASSGLEGTFDGLLNGEVPVTGRVAPQEGRVGARIQGADAGAALRSAGLFARADGGTLDLLLLPEGEASYRGELYVTGLRVVDAPVLASLLNAASIVGLLQQLGGSGILFDEVAATFRIDPGTVTVERSSAVGAGLGLSMDGTYGTEDGAMDFRGVVSPFYLINGIGSVLTRPGEGLLGFTWTLRGTDRAPVLGVNPASILAPGMVRDIFRDAARR